MWKPHADRMFATIIYNVTGAHLALSAIILLMVDHTHARIILQTWTQEEADKKHSYLPCFVTAGRDLWSRRWSGSSALTVVCGFIQPVSHVGHWEEELCEGKFLHTDVEK